MFNNYDNCSYSINLIVRDQNGNPIGKKEYHTDDAYKLWVFYNRFQGKPKRKKKKAKQNVDQTIEE